MPKSRWGLALGILLVTASAAWPPAVAAGPSGDGADGNRITLGGCLVRGDAGGYLLTNGPSLPAWQKADTSVTPGAVGTTGTIASVFYWLRDADGLLEQVGHRVEVDGDLDGQIADGEIQIARKAEWTEIEITIKPDGQSLKARVHQMAVVPVGDGGNKAPVLVRRVNVAEVRMISTNCQP